MPARLIVLGVAVVIHSIMSQLLYAGLFVAISVPVEQFRRGAELMSVHGAQLAGMGCDAACSGSKSKPGLSETGRTKRLLRAGWSAFSKQLTLRLVQFLCVAASRIALGEDAENCPVASNYRQFVRTFGIERSHDASDV